MAPRLRGGFRPGLRAENSRGSERGLVEQAALVRLRGAVRRTWKYKAVAAPVPACFFRRQHLWRAHAVGVVRAEFSALGGDRLSGILHGRVAMGRLRGMER